MKNLKTLQTLSKMGENIEQDSICLCENRSPRLYYRAAQL